MPSIIDGAGVLPILVIQHRDQCACELGISTPELEYIMDWRRRGAFDKLAMKRRALVVRMRDTNLPRQSVPPSFPEIARALGANNHSTVLTAYQRGKAADVDRRALASTPGAEAGR